MEEAIKKADVLIEVLPYIKKFHKKVIVIKYGGSILGDEKIRKGVLEDIVFLNFMGLHPVLVHGGGPNISDRMRSSGKKAEFIDGMRVTDQETLGIVEEELKNLNDIIINEISELGAKVVGLNGKENQLIQAEKKKAEIDLGLVGHAIGINTEIITAELKKDKIAVILPMGIGKDKKIYNINADEAAASIAVALEAEKFVLLTNIKGILRNPEDPNSFLSTLTTQEAKGLIEGNVIQEGMIPKVKACITALEDGVKKTHIIDARTPHALLLEIFTDQGIGTEIIR
ncbi:MAG: acetylglutamate kinase [Candidatus Omnitrophica bacterium CG08_land_8_20_14_0_20_41_16]|uniref:Acetylglutamate kinase n=1 Tax=Candidatus Sherwoodlollariibacterium unditelluris TaxID=1974757 RepID=A0A2G9YJA5_9BACT|nr:MAG: acetylglutamate kinase [Candidatus Omnitrophica bacterium CG23_combo_of_CG06-09_8_20_14_all_41_10]PIS33390.1 MAG: acetylglutamate kinase [Candidatus Omnitrophica bacterium CG08_land_8_20_14_0_20_41_16]